MTGIDASPMTADEIKGKMEVALYCNTPCWYVPDTRYSTLPLMLSLVTKARKNGGAADIHDVIVCSE